MFCFQFKATLLKFERYLIFSYHTNWVFFSFLSIHSDHKRERGNFWYDRGEYNLAIQLYRRSLEYLDDTDKYVGDTSKMEEVIDTNSIKKSEQVSEIRLHSQFSNDQLQELLETRVKVYNNLAAAQMKISAFDVALTSVDNVLRCQPENVKALFRKGKVRILKS